MKNHISEVDELLREKSKKNQKELDTALILPFSDDYSFSCNGVYFFCGKMSS